VSCLSGPRPDLVDRSPSLPSVLSYIAPRARSTRAVLPYPACEEAFHALVACACALGIAAADASSLRAQNNATVNATAAVQQPITVTAGNPLAFGNVFPGKATTISASSASAGNLLGNGSGKRGRQPDVRRAGELEIRCQQCADLELDGKLELTNAPTGTACTPSGTATPATFSASGRVFVFLGATVTPSVNQAAGTYTGTLAVTVSY